MQTLTAIKFSKNKTGRRRTKRRLLANFSQTRSIPMIVPARMIVRLPYGEPLNRAVVAPIDNYQWNLNSIFDPNRTGTGHQPLGHDQWAYFYNRYRVLRYEASIDLVNDSSSVPVRVSLIPLNGTTAPNGFTSVELPYAVSTIVGTSQGMSVKTLRVEVDLAKLNGKTPEQYRTSDVVGAVFGSSPTELMTLNLFASSLTGGNVSYSLVARMWYLVELSDPVELSDS